MVLGSAKTSKDAGLVPREVDNRKASRCQNNGRVGLRAGLRVGLRADLRADLRAGLRLRVGRATVRLGFEMGAGNTGSSPFCFCCADDRTIFEYKPHGRAVLQSSFAEQFCSLLHTRLYKSHRSHKLVLIPTFVYGAFTLFNHTLHIHTQHASQHYARHTTATTVASVVFYTRESAKFV
jgi:hypothetical protein